MITTILQPPDLLFYVGVAEIILRSLNKVSLKCLAARAVTRHGIEYEELVPPTLIDFIELHGPCKMASNLLLVIVYNLLLFYTFSPTTCACGVCEL